MEESLVIVKTADNLMYSSRGMVKWIMIYLWKTMQPQTMIIKKTMQG